jgi:biopolymer transport protein ExbB
MSGIFLQITETGQELVQNTQNVVSTAVTTTQETMSIWDLTMKGGWIMIPLFLLSIVAVYIFIERFIAIGKASSEDTNFMNNIKDFIHDGKIEPALALCKSNQTPIARMIEKGVQRIGRPLKDINAAIENVGKLEVSKLEKNVTSLAMVAGAAPMIGFLGTVIGMVKAFFDMAHAGNNIDIALLSSGIYQAMITTVGGLIVGIIGYICYNIIVARISKVVFILEARASELMDLLNEPAK